MEYKELKKLNQSLLKKILVSPKAYLTAKNSYENQTESVEDHFVFGTAVDIMLTGTKEEFDKKFVKIPDDTKCSETVKLIVDNVFAEVKDTPKDIVIDARPIILKYCNEAAYYNNWKDDTRIDKILADGKDYFELLKTTVGKTPITNSEYAKAVSCVMALKSDEFTKPYVDKKHDKDVEFWDKFIVEFELGGVQMKGELDRVVVNHREKLITPLDFKTTGKPITGFQYDFWSFRYDFQAATYLAGILQDEKIQKLIEDGYQIAHFLYIVVEKHLFNNPMVFAISEEVMDIGFSGGEVKGKKYEGLVDAITRFKYADENDAWDYPMEYYQHKGRLFIDI